MTEPGASGQAFEAWWDNPLKFYARKWPDERNTAKCAFDAGRQSRQAEVDAWQQECEAQQDRGRALTARVAELEGVLREARLDLYAWNHSYVADVSTADLLERIDAALTDTAAAAEAHDERLREEGRRAGLERLAAEFEERADRVGRSGPLLEELGNSEGAAGYKGRAETFAFCAERLRAEPATPREEKPNG
ncbi:MAG TPA: hypothetical protein VF171_01135 [Trueperaceae bacterium]